MNYFLSKVEGLQPKTFLPKRDPTMSETFQNRLPVEDFGLVASFSCAV